MTIGIIVIATNKYIKFFENLYNSCEKYLFPNTDKKYFLITDHPIQNYSNVITLFQQHEKWPNPTLKRFHYILSHRDLIESHNLTHLFYLDADMLIVDYVYETYFLEKCKDKLLAVYHPGYWKTSNKRGEPEQNQKSKCCILDKDHEYVAGGFQGGYTKLYFKAMEIMKNALDEDISNGIIPIWHDESVWNKFVSLNKNKIHFEIPEFCFPEGWDARKNLKGLKKKIVALNKNHEFFRS